MTDQSHKPSSGFTIYSMYLIATFFAFFQFFLQSATGILSTDWIHDFHLDKVELSNLSAAFFYTYAFMQIPAGILFDRFQPRYILAMAAFILTCGLFLLAYTDNYAIAVIARLLMGLGSSFGFVGCLQISARYFPPKRFALMVGISEGFTMLMVTGGVIMLTWLIAHYSWRDAMFGSGMVTFVTMLAVLFLLRKQTAIEHGDEVHILSFPAIIKRMQAIFTNRQVLLGSVYSFFMFSIVNAFTSLWGITFLINTYPITRQTAANMVAMIFIGIAIGSPFSGWLSKLINQHRPILIAAGGCATLTMSFIIFYSRIPALVLYVLFLLIGVFCSAYVQCFAVIKESVSPGIRATAMAATNMIIMLGAPILQLLIGWLLQKHFFGLATQTAENYRWGLSILPIGMLMAFLLAFGIKEPA